MISVNYNKVLIRKGNFLTCCCCGRNTVLSTLSYHLQSLFIP